VHKQIIHKERLSFGIFGSKKEGRSHFADISTYPDLWKLGEFYDQSNKPFGKNIIF
jgi:hypothetical protein